MPNNEVGAPIIAGNVQAEMTNLISSRRLIRAVKNPLDKCTVVSIFPEAIDEKKETIEPGRFHIDKGSFEAPAILIVGSSSWWKDVDIEQPMLEMQRSSIEVANSIVNDWCSGMLECNMADAMPGLFFVLGEHKVVDIKMKYKEKLNEVNEKQNNWYKRLVRHADSLWARGNGNPLVIWDTMRLAARSLHLDDKPWLKDFFAVQKVPCKACGSLKDPNYPVCQQCHAVDMTHPAAKDLKFTDVSNKL